MKKKIFLVLLTMIFSVCLFGFGIAAAGAQTESSVFRFIDGASIRYSENSGLRFIVMMDESKYSEIVEGDAYKDGKSLNVYIAPAEYFKKSASDLNAVADKAAVAEIKPESIYREDDGYYYANAVLTNILYQNTTREFCAVAAVLTNGEREFSEVSQARSVAYVASAALADKELQLSENQKSLLDGFVQKAVAYAQGVSGTDFIADGSYGVNIVMEEVLSLEPGESKALAPSVTPEVNLYTEWESDNEDVATVDENGLVTAVAKGTANITFSVYGETRTCAVKVEKLKNFGYYDFSEYEIGSTEIEGLTFTHNENNVTNRVVSVVEDEGEKVLKIEYTTKADNTSFVFDLDAEVIGDFSMFDYIDMEMKFVAEGNGGSGWLSEWYFNAMGISNSQTLKDTYDQWKTFTWDMNSTKGMVVKEKLADSFKFVMQPWAAQKVTVYLKSISGRFSNLETGDEVIDLTEKFSLSETEFTAEFISLGGEKTAVENVKAFIPQSEGKLIVTVHKDGYRVSAVEIKVIEKAAPGTLLNLSEYDVGDSYPISGGEAVVIFDEVSGKKALKMTNTGKNGSGVVLTISGDAVKELVNYDYFVIKARVYYEGVLANVNLQVSNVSGKPSWDDFPASNGGDGTAHEWVFGKTVNSWTFTSETESFTIELVKWNDAPQVTIITDIYAYNESAE